MNYIKIVILLLFCTTTLLAQAKKDSLHHNNSIQVSLTMPDTLQIKNVLNKQNDQEFWEKNLASFFVLFVGLGSITINYLISRQLRKSNEENLKKQIDAQFKATTVAKSRQEWINEVRNTVSEYLAIITSVAHPKLLLSLSTPELKRSHNEKVFFCKAKIDLLLNKDKEDQKELLDATTNLLQVALRSQDNYDGSELNKAREQTIETARKVFDKHWQKIKNLE